MCSCGARNIFSVGLICTCLALAPVGAKTPPASTVVTITAPSTVSTVHSYTIPYSMPNTVTGAQHQSPAALSRPMYQPDKTG